MIFIKSNTGNVIQSPNVETLGSSKKFGIGTAVNIGFFGLDMYGNMKNGDGLVKAGAKAGVNLLVFDAISSIIGGPTMLVGSLLSMTGSAIRSGIDSGRNNAHGMIRNREVTGGGGIGGGTVKSSEVGDTMRQRQLQQMGGYQNLVRGTLGSEGRRRSLMARYY